jgi:hypothetical protein
MTDFRNKFSVERIPIDMKPGPVEIMPPGLD